MKSIRMLVGAGVALALVAGFVSTRRASGSDSEADLVRKSCGAIVAGLNGHDAKAIATRFTEDADMIGPDGKLVSGRAAIEKAFADDWSGKGPMREAKVEVKDEPLRFPTADVAVSDAHATITGAYGPDGSKLPPLDIIATNVWKKMNGEWFVYASRLRLLTAPPPAMPK